MSWWDELFDPDIEDQEPHLMARVTDPDTSHEAAESILTSEVCVNVLNVIRGFGATGCISDEVEAMLPQYRSHTITPRYKQLIAKGFIEDTGERRMAASGRKQRVVRAKC